MQGVRTGRIHASSERSLVIPRNLVFDAIVSDLEHDEEHAALFRRVLDDHPDELAMEVITAALRHGWITPAEAIAIVRDGRFSFRRTVRVLAAFGDRRGWQPRELVLEALEGQPH